MASVIILSVTPHGTAPERISGLVFFLDGDKSVALHFCNDNYYRFILCNPNLAVFLNSFGCVRVFY